jgi:hypothetical protein
VWGGDHVNLVVTDAGGALEYDCAHGTIDQPLVIDSSGDSTSPARTPASTADRFEATKNRISIPPATLVARPTGRIGPDRHAHRLDRDSRHLHADARPDRPDRQVPLDRAGSEQLAFSFNKRRELMATPFRTGFEIRFSE